MRLLAAFCFVPGASAGCIARNPSCRMAQDAKNDKALRALQKQQDNKRCFNCDSLGTTYTVPQFNIFVCTDCSGVQ